jgi:hypothetical protein
MRCVRPRFAWPLLLSGLIFWLVLPLGSGDEGRRRAAFESSISRASWELGDQPAGPALRPGLDGPIAQSPNGLPAIPFALTPVALRTTAEIATEQEVRDRAATVRGDVRDRPEFEVPGRRQLPVDPRSPDISRWPPGPSQAEDPTLAPPTPFILTTGTTIEGPDLTSTMSFPPDTMGDVGSSQYFVALNGRMRVSNKSTRALEFDFDPDTFFAAAVRNNDLTTDPRVRYDRISGRWFVAYITIGIPNRVVLAVSSSATITAGTTWTYWFIANTVTNGSGQPCLADYETLGIDAHALYIGVNQFCGSSLLAASFFNTSAFIVNKASLFGSAATVSLISPLLNGLTGGPITPQGADNVAASPTYGYFVGVDALELGQLSVLRISNPGTSPAGTIVDVLVPATSVPFNVPHSGSSVLLDALDDRLMNAVVRNGRLYTAHAIGVNASGTTSGADRTAVRWYELENLASTPSLRQSGTIVDQAVSNPSFFWFPSINTNAAGDIVVGYASAGANRFAGAAASHRRAADPLGTMQAPVTLVNGSAVYNPGGAEEPYRWGDYSMVSVDPVDDTTFWTAQMYTSGANVYGTRAIRLTVSTTVPMAPTAVNDSYTTAFNSPLNVAAPGVLANDLTNNGGTMSSALVTSVSQGALIVNTDGGISYTPPPGFSGTVSFTYRATNTIGSSSPATVTITVLPASATPDPPSGLYVASVVANRVTLRWTRPVAGPTPTSFVLKGGLVQGETLAAIPTGSPEPIFTFEAPNGAFWIRMHSLNGVAESGPSNEVPLYVNVLHPPSAPAALLGYTSGSDVALSWNPTFDGGAPTEFVLDVTGALTASIPLGHVTSFAFSGVVDGTYTVALRAINSGGSSPPSNQLTLTFPGPCSGLPGAPTNFLAFKTGSVITVLWDGPTAGSAPTQYILTVAGPFSGSFATGGRTLRGTVLPGSYSLSVRAANPCGEGPVTPPVVVTIP